MRGSSFFEGVRQVDAEIAGQPAKLPAFYDAAAEISALFPARYGLRHFCPSCYSPMPSLRSSTMATRRQRL